MKKIYVKVKPGAKEAFVKKIDPTEEQTGEVRFEVAVKERPMRGKANRAVVAVFTEYFGVPQAQVSIVSGFTSKQKIIHITQTA